ncbi:MAG: 50S ribosome-binding GTPase [Phycisphaerae bacterium]|nr:50S ribosome-binding GTPase [Phycisphaerae bacterium]
METIAAIATPMARSARAVVRVSGDGARAVLGAVVVGGWAGWRREARTARVRMGDGLEMPVLVATYAGPGSYTGEDVAEVVVPGNPRVVERVLGAVLGVEGVRLAKAGEFSARAYARGRMTLEEAEGVAALIAAESEDDVRTARGLLSGATGSAYRSWSERVARVLALVEAGIDFSDQEDVEAIGEEELRQEIGEVVREIGGHWGGARAARSGLARVVLAGPPNAGKSTLMNALLGRRRVVESAEAGSTRDAIEERLELGPPTMGAVMLVDLPGLDSGSGEGGGEVSSGMRSLAEEAVRTADVVVWCDAEGGAPSVKTSGRVVRVWTKADRGARSGSAARSGEGGAIAVCALDGRNIGALRRAIAEAAVGGGLAALPRHREALSRARSRLEGALGEVGQAEVVAQELRLALDALGEVVGRITPDEVLGRVFASFCVGK